jgi:hypothetical protein
MHSNSQSRLLASRDLAHACGTQRRLQGMPPHLLKFGSPLAAVRRIGRAVLHNVDHTDMQTITRRSCRRFIAAPTPTCPPIASYAVYSGSSKPPFDAPSGCVPTYRGSRVSTVSTIACKTTLRWVHIDEDMAAQAHDSDQDVVANIWKT